MVAHSRYSVSAKGAGMSGEVLKNRLGITDQKMLDDAETLLLSDVYTHFFNRIEGEVFKFDLSFLFKIHKFFLGTLYSWAGKRRTVNITKDDVLFAPVEHLENTLNEFEILLQQSLPTSHDSKKVVAQKLALIHNELNAIHPFREGNGRTTRLFLDLIAAHAGYLPINWELTTQEKYIEACKLGMTKEHWLMEKIIYEGLMKR